MNLFAGRQKLNELTRIKDEANAYLNSLGVMQERLSLSTWLRGLVEPQSSNVLASTSLSPSSELNALCVALEGIEKLARETPVVSASVEAEVVRLRNLIRTEAQELDGIRTEIKAIEVLDAQAKGEALRLADIDRYLGQLQYAVNNYQQLNSDHGLKRKIEALEKKIAELEPTVSVEQVRAKTRKLLDEISDYCAQITPHLDAEWKEARISLSISDLAVKVKHDGREDYLWEVGSGANWLAYHIAMLLALQKLFLSKKTKDHSVPHLLIFDQPSQVYFPVKRAAKDYETGVDLNDEDRAAVRKVFVALGRAVRESEGRLQIIVLDHAGDEVWREIPGVVLTEEWRGKKLVPPEFEVGVPR